jgi:hypothetical protein
MGKKWMCVFIFGAIGWMHADARGQTSCPLTSPQLVASGLNDAANLVVDEGFVYYLDGRDGVQSVDKNGGTPGGVASFDSDYIDGEGGTRVFHVRVDEARVYINDPGGGPASGFRAGSVSVRLTETPDSGYGVSSSGTLLPFDCHVPMITDFVVAPNGDLYWIQNGIAKPQFGPCENDTQSTIVWLPAGTTTPKPILKTAGLASVLRADAIHVFWIEAEHIVRADLRGGNVNSIEAMVNLGGRPVADMNIDATHLYWSTPTDSSGNPATYVVPAPQQEMQILDVALTEIQTDGTFIYGDIRRDGPGAPDNVFRLKPNGHGLTNLAKGGGGGLAVDDTYLYFLDANRTNLLRTCKL